MSKLAQHGRQANAVKEVEATAAQLPKATYTVLYIPLQRFFPIDGPPGSRSMGPRDHGPGAYSGFEGLDMDACLEAIYGGKDRFCDAYVTVS